MLILPKVLRKQHFRLLPKKLHLGHLVQLLHLMEFLKLHESMDLLIVVVLRVVVALSLFYQELLEKPVLLVVPTVFVFRRFALLLQSHRPWCHFGADILVFKFDNFTSVLLEDLI